MLQVDGESHVLHTEEEAMGTRLVMDTLSCLIAKEADPSRLVALSPGKLVRQLVKTGERIEAGQAFAELEVMKMMMPLICPAAGVIHFQVWQLLYYWEVLLFTPAHWGAQSPRPLYYTAELCLHFCCAQLLLTDPD